MRSTLVTCGDTSTRPRVRQTRAVSTVSSLPVARSSKAGSTTPKCDPCSRSPQRSRRRAICVATRPAGNVGHGFSEVADSPPLGFGHKALISQGPPAFTVLEP